MSLDGCRHAHDVGYLYGYNAWVPKHVGVDLTLLCNHGIDGIVFDHLAHHKDKV